MYEFVLAICLVYDISGDPVNPCTMIPSPTVYASKAHCRSEAKRMEIQYFDLFSREYPEASIVMSSPCGTSTRQGS